jgi:hypothetical protein
MGSSRDLWDEAVEDANATVTGNITRPLGSYITPIPYPHGAVGASGSVVGAPPTTASELAVMTSHGKVKINLDTGVLTIPHGIGREEAIRDFWLGFQENFRGAERAKYEDEVASLKKHISYITQKAEEYKNEVLDTAKKSVVKKIAEKYGNEKFIMVKPADLIKFIEEA